MKQSEYTPAYKWFNLIAETEGQTHFQSDQLKGAVIKDLFIDDWINIIPYKLNAKDGIIIFNEPFEKGTKISINPV